ncbi:sugar transferase [Candidatus Pelagibacter sp.]|nr:sugar transferase [Candidatus Pelagibacter sp.]MDB4812008.1 sugar transferase [Candidatus Pelagibacter sp.]MDC0466002.1 sugar transferase [Candidatus Pelagibacter sp.]
MIRLFDFSFSFFGLIFLSPIIILIWVIGLFENGSPLFIQKRIGCSKKLFLLIKFRTMKKETISKATHLVKDSMITKFGNFLRVTKLDEVLQLFNVLVGDMSLVGPRPCLVNQKKLIREREKRGVFKVKPGITGLAQISGINMKTPILLAKTDLKMIKDMNLYFYFYYILKTLIKILIK